MHAPGPIEPKRSKRARPLELSIAAPAESEGFNPLKVHAPAVSRAERHARNATTDFPVNGAHGLLVHSVLSAQTGLTLRLLPKIDGNPAAAAT
jgi:hypothetical protein